CAHCRSPGRTRRAPGRRRSSRPRGTQTSRARARTAATRGSPPSRPTPARPTLPLAANVTEVRGDEVTRIRWGGTLLEEARLHAPRRLLTAAPFAFEACVESTQSQA